MSDAASGHPLDQLSPYLDDELAVEERARIDRHLASCEGCRGHLQALRRISSAIASEPIPPPPDGLESAVLRRLDAAAVVPYRRRFIVPASIAATVAAVGLLTVVAWKQNGPRVVPARQSEKTQASGSLEGGVAPDENEADAAGRLNAPSPRQAPSPPPAALPETPARKREETELKAKRDDVLLDKMADEGTPPPPVGAVGAAEAKDAPAPAAVASGAALNRMEGAPAPQVQPEGSAAGPVSSCAAGTVDSPLEAVWEVADRANAGRTLATLASMVAGRVELSGGGAVDEVTVVVPVVRFDAFAKAARAIGVDGLAGATPPAEAGCVRQRIRLVTAAPR